MAEKIYEINGNEYAEVDRPAEVGDIIVITSEDYAVGDYYYDVGHFGRVLEVLGLRKVVADFNEFNNPFVDRDGLWLVGESTMGEYAVLERLTNRNETGIRGDYRTTAVRITSTPNDYCWYADKVGEVFEVTARIDDSSAYYFMDDVDNMYLIDRADAEEISPQRLAEEVAERIQTPTEKHVIALAREVAELRKQVAEADYKAGQALTSTEKQAETIEMLTDDVVLLDERTQPLVDEGISDLSRELAGLVERHIGELREKGRI